VNRQTIQRQLAGSRAARAAAFPGRALTAAKATARTGRAAVRWLATSRERTNLTYPIDALNRSDLAWFIAHVTGTPVSEIRGYLEEIDHDQLLVRHVVATTGASPYRRLADPEPRFAKRAGWYAYVRAVKPNHVVESGIDKGLGTIALAAAARRNHLDGFDTVVSGLDINPEAGYLVRSGPYAEFVRLKIGDSLATIPLLDPVDLFIHDSNHSAAHERSELALIQSVLAPNGVVMSDNAHVTPVLSEWSEQHSRHFLFWQERPEDHFYPGGGIGVSWVR
jgi:hypothetical protein